MASTTTRSDIERGGRRSLNRLEPEDGLVASCDATAGFEVGKQWAKACPSTTFLTTTLLAALVWSPPAHARKPTAVRMEDVVAARRPDGQLVMMYLRRRSLTMASGQLPNWGLYPPLEDHFTRQGRGRYVQRDQDSEACDVLGKPNLREKTIKIGHKEVRFSDKQWIGCNRKRVWSEHAWSLPRATLPTATGCKAAVYTFMIVSKTLLEVDAPTVVVTDKCDGRLTVAGGPLDSVHSEPLVVGELSPGKGHYAGSDTFTTQPLMTRPVLVIRWKRGASKMQMHYRPNGPRSRRVRGELSLQRAEMWKERSWRDIWRAVVDAFHGA